MSRNHSLDGLRGLAALTVALAHCNLAVMGPVPWEATIRDFASLPVRDIASSLLYVIFPGHAAVTLFFVLSGHVLWRSFLRKRPNSLFDLPDYLVGRAYRLLPVAVASAVPLAFLTDASARELVANMLLLSHSLNGVLWSLQVEAVCSLAIVLAWLTMRDSPIRIVLLLVAVLAVSPLFRGSNFFLYFPAFLLGALIDAVPKAVWSRSAVLGAGLAALVLSHLLAPHAIARHVEMAGAMMVVGCLGASPQPLLLTGPVQFLGAVSYPFYLAHPSALLIGKATGIAAGTADPFADMACLAAFSVPLALAMAWLLHVAVEEPAMRARPRITLSGLRLRFAAARNSLPEPS